MSKGIGQVARMDTTKSEAGEWILKRLWQVNGEEEKARELLEWLRWRNGPICPHCKTPAKSGSPNWRRKPEAKVECAKVSIFAEPVANSSPSQ